MNFSLAFIAKFWGKKIECWWVFKWIRDGNFWFIVRTFDKPTSTKLFSFQFTYAVKVLEIVVRLATNSSLCFDGMGFRVIYAKFSVTSTLENLNGFRITHFIRKIKSKDLKSTGAYTISSIFQCKQISKALIVSKIYNFYTHRSLEVHSNLWKANTSTRTYAYRI